MPKAKNAGSKKTKSIQNPLTKAKQKQLVKDFNNAMLRLKDYAHELDIPSFGNSLYGNNSSQLSSNTLPDINTVIASTIADRITGKFEVPDFSAEQRLRRECNEAWLLYESDHLAQNKWDNVGIQTRGVIYRARDLVEKWLNGYTNGRYRWEQSFFKFFEDAPIAFGPGESFISKNGDVSTFSKLDPYNFTVTIDVLEEASLFIALNKGLRTILSEEFKKIELQRKIKAKRRGTKYVRVRYEPFSDNADLSLGVRIFAARVRSFLLQNGLVQRGSRGSSVYKNSKKRRFINVECFLNVVLQKGAGYALRQCLKINANCDLDLGQDFHKLLISQPGWSTVDWSNASDSILCWLLEQLMMKNQKIFRILDTLRSKFVLIDTPFINEHDRSDHYKMYHIPHKFSSMGNGFTFEVLTLVNLAIVRVMDQQATVYGDDVILRSVYAEQFINHMQKVGFVPNLKKSFINLPFRESCGGFYEDRIGYIRSYDFKWNYNIADCIVTFNKIGRILRSHITWEHKLRDRMVNIYDELKALLPSTLCGPLVDSPDIPLWFERKNYKTKHSHDPFCKKKWDAFSTVATEMAVLHQHTELLEKGYDPGYFSIVMVPELRKKVKVQPQRNVRSMRLAYSYIYSGIVSPMLLRQSKNEYEFGFKPTLVHSEGWSVRVGTARTITKKALQFELLGKISYPAM